MSNIGIFSRRHGNRMVGFSLLELLVAMAIFGVIAASAFGLMSQHQPLFSQQQSLGALNIGMRNAIAQMQVDIVNGGAGYYTNINIPNWPVGVVINNSVVASSGDCHTGTTYGANCFDSFTVIASDPAVTPVNLLASSSGSLPVVAGTCASSTTNTNVDKDIFVLPPAAVTPATYAANFKNGDQVLLVNATGAQYTTVKLTVNGTTAVVGGTTYVKLHHNILTANDGTNSASDDATGMTLHSNDQTYFQFCATDWLIRLVPTEYDVDITTNPADPVLRRTTLVQGHTPATDGVPLVDQVIGFKVGASLFNGSTDIVKYNFDNSTFGTGYDYTLVRSVMISLVGRTPPVPDPTYTFRNTFDSGPYQIQGVSVVVNPRNMSMAD